MKKILIFFIFAFSMLLSSCSNTSIGKVGGTDRPQKVYIKGQFGEQYEKKPVRMINIDGDLYYDSGYNSEVTPRCGTMDGGLKKTAGENEVPHKSGEANFDAKGYQIATGITKEVPIDGEWRIFKKYDTYGRNVENLKYCYYIKGRLKNASADSEMVVLSDNPDITFNDVMASMLSSVKLPNKGILFSHNFILSSDKWGITLYGDDITNKGMTIKFEQFMGDYKGELQTGDWFKLEKNVDGEWISVETNPLIDYAWRMIAYKIKKNDITEFKVEWKWLYGELKPGYYRLSKEVMDFVKAGEFEKKLYYIDFNIE